MKNPYQFPDQYQAIFEEALRNRKKSSSQKWDELLNLIQFGLELNHALQTRNSQKK